VSLRGAGEGGAQRRRHVLGHGCSNSSRGAEPAWGWGVGHLLGAGCFRGSPGADRSRSRCGDVSCRGAGRGALRVPCPRGANTYRSGGDSRCGSPEVPAQRIRMDLWICGSVGVMRAGCDGDVVGLCSGGVDSFRPLVRCCYSPK
jgi:hypothetical protein